MNLIARSSQAASMSLPILQQYNADNNLVEGSDWVKSERKEDNWDVWEVINPVKQAYSEYNIKPKLLGHILHQTL